MNKVLKIFVILLVRYLEVVTTIWLVIKTMSITNLPLTVFLNIGFLSILGFVYLTIIDFLIQRTIRLKHQFGELRIKRGETQDTYRLVITTPLDELKDEEQVTLKVKYTNTLDNIENNKLIS